MGDVEEFESGCMLRAMCDRNPIATAMKTKGRETSGEQPADIQETVARAQIRGPAVPVCLRTSIFLFHSSPSFVFLSLLRNFTAFQLISDPRPPLFLLVFPGLPFVPFVPTLFLLTAYPTVPHMGSQDYVYLTHWTVSFLRVRITSALNVCE